MIDRLSVSIHLSGDSFSPKIVEEALGWSFDEKSEKGDLVKHGRYAKEGYTTGWARLKSSPSVDQFDQIRVLAEMIISKRAVLDEHGVSDRYLYLGYFYKDQCNFEFSQAETELISKAGLSLGISCYDISDD